MDSISSIGCLVILLAVSNAQVEELTDANFQNTVSSHSYVMVAFYSPICPHCQAMLPNYTAAEVNLRASHPSVLVAEVDCTSDASTKACSDIKYVPWIVMYHNGREYMKFENRSRTPSGIVQFVVDATTSNGQAPQEDFSIPKVQPPNTCDQTNSKQLLAAAMANTLAPAPTPEPPSPVNVLTDANFDTFVKSYPYVIVDYYTPWCSDCKHLKPLYDEAATKLSKTTPSIRFAKVDCNQGNTATFLTCQNSKLKFYPWVVLFHDGRPQNFLNMENVPDVNTIYNFINKDTNIIGGVMDLDDSNFDSTIGGFSTAVVNFYAPWCFYCKKMAPVYEDLAKDEQEAHPSVRLIKVDCSSTNPKTKTICARNDISFLPTLKVFEHGRFIKEYEGDKTKKEGLSGFISDVLTQQQEQQSIRRSMKDKENKKKQEEKKKDSPKIKTSKDKKSKKDDKKSSKKKHKENDAAKILKKVFKQFSKKIQSKKSKSSKNDDEDEDDDDDDDDEDRNKSTWQQVAQDIHRIAKDMHKLTKEFRRSLNKQPAVDRLVKAFRKVIKSKEEEDKK